jgi:hypothetical protein
MGGVYIRTLAFDLKADLVSRHNTHHNKRFKIPKEKSEVQVSTHGRGFSDQFAISNPYQME